MHGVLGVTGAIGAGKSTVCRLLARRGWSLCDVDDVAAEALAQARPFLAERLPAALLATGDIDKGRVFAAMLGDPLFGEALERELAPVVRQRVADWIARLDGPGALDAALLFEAGLDRLCDATLCVTCPVDERRRRVALRPTASARHFDALASRQWPESAKRQAAGASLDGDGPPELLEPRLERALASLGWRL